MKEITRNKLQQKILDNTVPGQEYSAAQINDLISTCPKDRVAVSTTASILRTMRGHGLVTSELVNGRMVWVVVG